jgi:fatty-acyl-CoA synthase
MNETIGVEPSYVQGLTLEPRIGLTIGAALDRAVAAHGGREALVSRAQGIRLDYHQFNARVNDCAAGLIALGLERGDRIGIWSPNTAEWAILQFASAKAGLVLVTINPAYRVSELEYALNAVQCRALVLARRFKTSDYVAMLGELAPELADCAPGALAAARLPHLKLCVAIGDAAPPSGMIRFEDIEAAATQPAHERCRSLAADLQFDDAINIQFTSGTTGTPKGATLSHHNILNNGYFVGRGIALQAGDRICIPVPPSPMARPWSTRRRVSTRVRPWRLSRRNAARISTACRPCSSPNSTIRISRPSILPRCGAGSWREPPARSR